MHSERSVTVRAGKFGHSWHAAHLTLALATLGWWLIAYAIHGIIWAVNRPTVTVTVPEGARIEYRQGYPNVLMPDEWLEPRSRGEWLRAFFPYAFPTVLAIALVVVTMR